MTYVGNFALEKTFDVKFTTVDSTGAPTVLAGSPVISAYVGNSTTQLTAGITLSVDFDGVVGLNNIRVVATAANGYATASNYQLVITTGTVGGVSVVGYVVAQFSIEARAAVRPTVVDRTLDVSAGGEAGLDWANIGSPTAAQNLSATNIDVDQVVASVTGIVTANVTQLGGVAQSLTDLKDFADDGYDPATNKVQGVVLTDTLTTYTGNTTQTGDSFARLGLPAGASVSADIAAIEAQTDDIGVAGAGLTAIVWNSDWDAEVQSEVTDALNAYDPPTNAELVSEINSVQADIAALNNLSAAQVNTEADTALADVGLTTTITGRIDAAITSRASQASLDTVDNLIDTEITDIQARLPAALVSGRMDASVGAMAAGVVTAAAVATDAIDSDAMAANAITEIQNGLATAAALALVSAFVDTEITTLQADVSAILADTGTDGVAVAAASKTGYALSAAGVDEIFDELRAGHSVVGSYGESFYTLESGAAIAGTLSTTQMSTNLTEATDDHYKGRIIIWVSGVLLRQATDITAYNGTTKVLTFTALTEAPSAADKFIIV